jgi:hypothetical protein
MKTLMIDFVPAIPPMPVRWEDIRHSRLDSSIWLAQGFDGASLQKLRQFLPQRKIEAVVAA